jgi:hypothetical protein
MDTKTYMKLQRAVKKRRRVRTENRPVYVDGRLEDRQVCIVEAER